MVGEAVGRSVDGEAVGSPWIGGTVVPVASYSTHSTSQGIVKAKATVRLSGFSSSTSTSAHNSSVTSESPVTKLPLK